MDFSTNTNGPTNKRNVILLLLATFLILILIVSFFYFYKFETFEPSIQPSGKVYLSLAPISDQSSYLNIYTLDTNTNKFNLLLSEPYGIDYLTPSFSQDGSQVALVSLTDYEEANILIVPKKDFLLGRINQNSRSIGVTYYPEYPEWSPNNKYLVYSIFEESDILSPEDYYVYILDLESGAETHVTKGAYPQYIDDNNIMILKNDGLYIVNLNNINTTASLVWSIEGGDALTNMKFDIALDKSKIVWTIPWMEEIFEIKVSSWNPFVGEISELLPTQGYLPFYSVDGDYLSFIQFTEVENIMKTNLTVYDILTKKEIQSVDLSEYYTDGIFLSDWR